MTCGIREARERLGAARSKLVARPGEKTVDSLARLMDDWSRPDSPWQERLARELPAATGFTVENVREGLARALSGWTGDAVRELALRELGGPGRGTVATGFDQTSVLLAGSIPMPTILSLMAPLLLHSPVLAKPASRDRVTARVFAESLADVDPDLAGALEIVDFGRDDEEAAADFFDTDCVVATGSDETIASVFRVVRPGTRLVAYGHRLSVAVVGEDAACDEGVARRLAEDVALWDQLGCLSPVAVFCCGSADRFAESLARALAEIETELPTGERSVSAAAAIRRERDEAQMRAAGGADVRVHAHDALRFVVVRESDATWRPAPLHRFVRVHPVPDRKALLGALAPVARYLAAIAVAGVGTADLVRSGASRLCDPGSMQAPPLGWHHDGQPVLLPLARLVDVSQR